MLDDLRVETSEIICLEEEIFIADFGLINYPTRKLCSEQNSHRNYTEDKRHELEFKKAQFYHPLLSLWGIPSNNFSRMQKP